MVEADDSGERQNTAGDFLQQEPAGQSDEPKFMHACRTRREAKKDRIARASVVRDDACPFMVIAGKRACRKAILKPSRYCVVHAYVDTPDLEYVECPYEPKNRFPKYQLEHHLKVCPKALEISKVEAQPFFKKGINFFRQQLTEEGQQSNEEEKAVIASVDSSHFAELINSAYEKLKVKYGSVPSFQELFTIDEQMDFWEKLNAEQ